jgi:LmbE family N-acetylglucosaminyl deacetylase
MAGGTMHKLTKSGNECIHVALSDCGIEGIRDEFTNANIALGINEAWVSGFDKRELSDVKVLQFLVDLKNSYQPDYVFTHSKEDFHLAHSCVGRMALNAFKHTNLIVQVAEWNQRAFNNNYFVKLSGDDMESKLQALSCYKSQSEKTYFTKAHILSRALVYGQAVNTLYAEAFHAINLIC